MGLATFNPRDDSGIMWSGYKSYSPQSAVQHKQTPTKYYSVCVVSILSTLAINLGDKNLSLEL